MTTDNEPARTIAESAISYSTDRETSEVGTEKGTALWRPWQPGQSGNPAGRNGTDLVRYIKAKSNGGRDLVDNLLACAMDGRARWRDRVAATTELLNRGWGKPRESVDVNVTESTTIKLRWGSSPPSNERTTLDSPEVRVLPPGDQDD